MSNNEHLIKNIKKNLYRLIKILNNSNTIKLLKKNDIEILKFSIDIESKIEKFDLLKELNNSENQLEVLKEELQIFIDYTKNEFNINHKKIELSQSVEFIKRRNFSIFIADNKKNSISNQDIIPSTYLEAIKIKNYFSIKKEMEIQNLKDKKEIYFVGENGDGKTVLLQAILLALKGDEYKTLEYTKNYAKEIILSTKDRESPNNYKRYRDVKNLFAYGINRNKVHYTDFDKNGFSGLFDTSDSRKTTWLQEPAIVLKENHKIIDEFIEKLNKNIFINDLKIEKDKNSNLVFKENDKPIKFNELSEGYKSTIIWLCDLVSRLKKNQPKIEQIEKYQAIVLIDEVDLYLHPKWKYDFVNNLRSVFKNIQFIMTTHSIVTVLGASEDAVFYKVYKEDGDTKITPPRKHLSYYTSDILMTSPIFSLPTMKARGFDGREGISNDDYIYHKIHKVIDNKIKKDPNLTDDEIEKLIEAELEKEMSGLDERS